MNTTHSPENLEPRFRTEQLNADSPDIATAARMIYELQHEMENADKKRGEKEKKLTGKALQAELQEIVEEMGDEFESGLVSYTAVYEGDKMAGVSAVELVPNEAGDSAVAFSRVFGIKKPFRGTSAYRTLQTATARNAMSTATENDLTVTAAMAEERTPHSTRLGHAGLRGAFLKGKDGSLVALPNIPVPASDHIYSDDAEGSHYNLLVSAPDGGTAITTEQLLTALDINYSTLHEDGNESINTVIEKVGKLQRDIVERLSQTTGEVALLSGPKLREQIERGEVVDQSKFSAWLEKNEPDLSQRLKAIQKEVDNMNQQI